MATCCIGATLLALASAVALMVALGMLIVLSWTLHAVAPARNTRVAVRLVTRVRVFMLVSPFQEKQPAGLLRTRSLHGQPTERRVVLLSFAFVVAIPLSTACARQRRVVADRPGNARNGRVSCPRHGERGRPGYEGNRFVTIVTLCVRTS